MLRLGATETNLPMAKTLVQKLKLTLAREKCDPPAETYNLGEKHAKCTLPF
jgi:hypothetical protein